MLPGQMSPWQLKSVLDVPRNLSLNFHQNRVSNSWDITDIEFLWGLQSHFMVKPNLVLRLGLGFDNIFCHGDPRSKFLPRHQISSRGPLGWSSLGGSRTQKLCNSWLYPVLLPGQLGSCFQSMDPLVVQIRSIKGWCLQKWAPSNAFDPTFLVQNPFLLLKWGCFQKTRAPINVLTQKNMAKSKRWIM